MPQERSPRPPTLLDALAPVVVLILLIALTIASFGVAATDGPLQVALMLSITAGDQYVADVLPARMFRDEFRRRALAPQVLSRAAEDSGTVTSPLEPWSTCGAYMSGVLGVSTAAYLPFCFVNLLSPILDVLYGFLGFKVQTVDPAHTAVEAADGTPHQRIPPRNED